MSFFTSAQTIYKAAVTEMYTWNVSNNEWDLYQKHSDVKIEVCVEDEFITIFAQSPTMYKIYKNTKEQISFSKYSGHRYTAKDLKTDSFVTVEIVGNLDDQVALLSIINKSEKYNLRYFLIVN